MLYELRSYEAVPGKMAVLDKHLEVACRLFPKHGLPIVGAWTDEIGTGSRIRYMWAAKDDTARNAGLASFAADPEWKSHMETEKREHGNVVANVANRVMRATPYSPPVRLSGKYQELRVYEAMPGRLPDLHARFQNHTIGFFRKHGIGLCGFWTELYGDSNRLVYMTSFNALSEREHNWTAFANDPDWMKARVESERPGGPLVVRTHSELLKPTKFSPAA